MEKSKAEMNFTNSTAQCKPGPIYDVALLFPIPILAVIVNITIALAATLHRKTILRQNYVYFCVLSTLSSNAIASILNLWDDAATVYAIQSNQLSAEAADLNLWVICQVASTSMLFVISFNVCALIYVMLDTSYFHSAAKHSQLGRQLISASKTLAKKKSKTIALVALSWLLPLITGVLAITFWNCKKFCDCIHGAQGVLCPDKQCSKIWPPLKTNFIATQLGLWFVEIFSLLFFVVKGLREFIDFIRLKSTFRSKGSFKSTISTSNSQQMSVSPMSENRSEKIGTDIQQNSPKKTQGLPRWKSWNSRLQLAFILFFLYAICTCPLAVMFLLELTKQDIDFTTARLTSSLFLQLFFLVCPILMVKYMPNLRRAQLRLSESMTSCFN